MSQNASSVKIFLSYYKGLINSGDMESRADIAKSFVSYVNVSLEKSHGCPAFLSEPSEGEDISNACFEDFSRIYDTKSLTLKLMKEEFLRGRCRVMFFDEFATNVLDAAVQSTAEGSESLLASLIFKRSKSYIGNYNESINTTMEFRAEYKRLISQFLNQNFSVDSISKIEVEGCEDIEILREFDIEGLDVDEMISICKLRGQESVGKSMDGAFSFVASRILSQPADFLMKDQYMQKVFDSINIENFELAGKAISAAYYFFTGIPGILLSSNIPMAIAKKIAIIIASERAYEYSMCIAKKLGEESKNIPKNEKKRLYRAVIVILWGIEMKQYKSPTVKILGREYVVSEAENNITNAYNDISRYIEDQLSDPEKSKKYYNCIV